MQRPRNTYWPIILAALALILFPLLLFMYSSFSKAGRNLVGATMTVETTPIPSLDTQTIGDMTVTLYPGDITAGSVGVIAAISGWKEYYFIENVWFQSIGRNPVRMDGVLAKTSVYESSYIAQIEFVTLTELPLEKLEGEIVLQVSRHLGSQFAEFQLYLNLELPHPVIFNVMQTVSSNGVEVTLQSIEATPLNTVINLCFTKPTPAEWKLGNVTLKTEEISVRKIDEYLLFDSDLNQGVPPGWVPTGFSGYCEKITFPPMQNIGATEMILAIDELDQPIPEKLIDSDVRKIQPELALYGIELAFRPMPESETGAGAWEITKKPVGMDDPAVWHVIYTALGYYHLGPWIFKIESTIEQP